MDAQHTKTLIQRNADAIRKYRPDLANALLTHDLVKTEFQLGPIVLDTVCKRCGDKMSLGIHDIDLEYGSAKEVGECWDTLLNCNDTIIKEVIQ